MTEKRYHKMFGLAERSSQAAAFLSEHLRAVLHLPGALDGSRGPRLAQRRTLLFGERVSGRGRRRCTGRRRGPAEPSTAPDTLAGRHCGARRTRLQSTATPILLLGFASESFFVHFASLWLYTMTLRTQSQCVTLCCKY